MSLVLDEGFVLTENMHSLCGIRNIDLWDYTVVLVDVKGYLSGNLKSRSARSNTRFMVQSCMRNLFVVAEGFVLPRTMDPFAGSMMQTRDPYPHVHDERFLY
jgi:hypothetical protein